MAQAKGPGGALTNQKEIVIGAVIAALLICLGILKVVLQSPAPSEPAPSRNREAAAVAPEEPPAQASQNNELEAKKREKALAAIAEHEAIIDANWQADDTPDRLMAIGNLHQYQLKDYYSAIDNYRKLIGSFPDYKQAPQGYVEMASCYEKIGDEVQAKFVYEEMLDSLEPSTEYYRYAKAKLEE